MADTPHDLGDLEGEVMQIVWSHGPLMADAVRERLPRPLKESTVRTVLRRLEEKNYVTHTVDGRTFVYRATEARETIAAKAVKRIVDWFCAGAMDDVLVGMVDNDLLPPDQLQRLEDKIAELKKKRAKAPRD